MDNKELTSQFQGKITLESELPFDTSTLPNEAGQHVSEGLNKSKKYVVAKEDNKVVGFSVIQIPESTAESVKFLYRYVFPNDRRKGIGKILRDSTYDKSHELGYKTVDSGINNVLKITQDGVVSKNMDSNIDGGWKSYMSMTSTNPATNIHHKVLWLTINKQGLVNLTFETKLGTGSTKVLPDSPDELMDLLRESNVIPSKMSNRQLFDEGQDGPVAFKDGSKLTHDEYLGLLSPAR